MGQLTLEVPRCKDGSFSTKLFERYQRSEKALVLLVSPTNLTGGGGPFLIEPGRTALHNIIDVTTLNYFRRHHGDLFPNLREIRRGASHPSIGKPVGGKISVASAPPSSPLAKPSGSGRPAPLGCRQHSNAGMPIHSSLAVQSLSSGRRLRIQRDHQIDDVGVPRQRGDRLAGRYHITNVSIAQKVTVGCSDRGFRTVLHDKGYWSPWLDANLDDSIRIEAEKICKQLRTRG